jgi:integrase
MPKRLRNIRRWKKGWQASFESHGKSRAKSFPLSTKVPVMRAWLEKERKRLKPPSDEHGSFGADITTYLTRIHAMPTYKQKAAHLELWAHALGRDRPRSSITSAEIDAVMQRWLTTPTKPKKGRPSGARGLDPQTVRKRRTSLLSLFVTLDGKAAENPVRATYNPAPPKPEIRGADYNTVARIIAALPDYRDTLKGQPRKLNLAKLRIAVLAYTGLPPGILASVRPADVNLKAGTVRIKPRVKGAGVEARTLPLTPQGVAAFTAYLAAGACTTFAPGSVNVSFKRACHRADVRGLTLYDLRHAFGAQLYRVTRDEATVARFLLHAEGSTQTARYKQAANADVDRAAAAAFGAALAG